MASGSPSPTLTQTQSLFWTGQRLHPSVPLYNMGFDFALDGAIDPVAFGAAFAAVVADSDALRSVFPAGETPVRAVADDIDASVPVVDLRRDADPTRAAREWVDTRVAEPLDVTRRSFDTALLRVGDAAWVWYLNQHHLVTDGWSSTIVVERMCSLYARAIAGTLDERPAVPTFADYAVFEGERAAAPSAAKARAHWQAAAERAADDLPFYGRAEVDPTTRTVRERVPLGRERSDAIRALADAPEFRALTPDLSHFHVFATVLATFLARVNDAEHVTFLAPAHNRSSRAFKETIGVFIGIHPLSATVRVGDTFADLAAQLAGETRAFLLNAQPGTGAVQREASVMLNLIPAPFPRFGDRTMRSRWLHSGHGDDGHALHVHVHDFDGTGEWELLVDANCGQFDDDQRARAIAHLVTLLDACLADPFVRVHDIDLRTDIERARQRAFNDTAVPPPSMTVPAAVSRWMADTPAAPAVRDGGRTFTYGELDEAADRVAAALGDRRSERVGILLPRSFDLVAAVLGVLRTGGAYVPLDPRAPSARTSGLVADAELSAIVTSRELTSGDLAGGTLATVLVEDADGTAPPSPAIGFDDPAYVMFTSGSTGRPKGVAVSHGALAHYVDFAARQYVGEQRLAVPLYSSFTFDLTVTSLFVPLATGGEIVVYDDGSSRDLSILAVLDDDAVDLVKLTPAHLALATSLERRGSRVKTLVLGGEDLKRSLADAARVTFGDDVTIYNEYGPTEATVGTMVHRFDPDRDTHASVPIGRPIPNAEVHLVDRARRPVPAGVTGEIAIGGPGLAAGYFGRDDLTDAQFVENPFGPGRLYLTGDRARWRCDGSLEFLGRNDDQVKIGGARIELAEVEAATLDVDGVDAATVVPVEVGTRAGGPERRLAAYVVGSATVDRVRAVLADRLPVVMRPSFVVSIAALPLTPNGKVDRARLPSPVTRAHTPADRAVTDAEVSLAAIWADVLGRDTVGRHDDFIELGGDSIMNLQIVSRAHAEGFDITPRQLFDHPTVAELARVAARRRETDDEPFVGRIEPTPIQRWFFDLALSSPGAWRQRVSLETAHPIDVDRVRAAWARVVDHHDMLRASFRRSGSAWIQEVPPRGVATESPWGEHSTLRITSPTSLDIDIHHLVVDGLSWSTLLDDFERALRDGPDVALPSRTASFAAWSEHVHARVDRTRTESEFWSRRPSPLPVDGPPTGVEHTVERRLTSAETEALAHAASAAFNTTIEDALLAALAFAVGEWTSLDRIEVMLERHGRDGDAGLNVSRTVGWFTTFHPVFIDGAREPASDVRIKHVKERVRAVPDDGLGYGILRWLDPTAPLADVDMPDLLLNYMGRFDRMTTPGATLRVASPLALVRESGPAFPLEVFGVIHGGELVVEWAHDRGRHEPATVERLADRTMADLRRLIGDLSGATVGGFTPSDFPDAELSQDELDDLLDDLED